MAMRKNVGGLSPPSVWLWVGVLVFLMGVGGVKSDPMDAAAAASTSILDIMDGRGQAANIQNSILRHPFTEQNLDGNVEAASAGAQLQSLARPYIEHLEEMRDCISNAVENEKRALKGERQANRRAKRQDGEADEDDPEGLFEADGYLSDRGWGRTKEEDELASECLIEIFNEDHDSLHDELTEMVSQHFGGASGYIRGQFSNPDYVDRTSFEEMDPRLKPFFVASTTYQKDVVLLLDLTGVPSKSWLNSIKAGTINVIEGLYDKDFAQVLVLREGRILQFRCGGDLLLRMTASNKRAMIDFVNSLTRPDPEKEGRKGLTDFFDAGFDLLEQSRNTENNSHSNCESVFLFVSRQQPSGATASNIRRRNRDFAARIFTFAIQSSTNPEGYLGGGNVYDIACDNSGSWYNIQEEGELEEEMIKYQIIIQKSRRIEEITFFVSHPTYGPWDGGIAIVASLPVYDGKTKDLIGVVSVEYGFSDIIFYFNSLTRGVTFPFLTTLQGDLLLHPSYRSPEVVTRLPTYYDVSLIERSENFTDFVRSPLVTEPNGRVTVTVDRPLPRGDVVTDGISTPKLKTTFFWTRIPSLGLIVCVAFADAQLRSPTFIANEDSEWVGSTRSFLLLDAMGENPDWEDYFPDDYFDAMVDTPGGRRHFRYAHLNEYMRVYNNELIQQILSTGVTNGVMDESNIMRQTDTVKSQVTFLNNLNTSFTRNPGMLNQVKELTKMGSQFAKLWSEDYFSFCSPLFEDCTGREQDPSEFRFMGFRTDSSITFPALVNYFRSFSVSYFQPSLRPWYQKASATPDAACVTTPYSDTNTGSKVTTVSKAIFADPTRPVDDREILGVVGIDYLYPDFHNNFVEISGCAYDRDSVTPTAPLCYMLDNSGLLVFAPDFLTADFNTFGETASDRLPLYLAEPQLMRQLVEMGIMKSVTYLNYKGTVATTVFDDDGNAVDAFSTFVDVPIEVHLWQVDEDVLNSMEDGIATGELTKSDGYCTSGSFSFLRVPDTNTYLIQIENYDRDESDDCATFESPPPQNVTYEACSEDTASRVYAKGTCPNSDQRASVTEANRPDDAQCDLEPPKPRDFVEWDDPVAIAMVTVTGVLIIFTCVLWVIIFMYRATPVVLMASPVFIYLQFLGFILGYCTVLLWTGEPTDVQCALRPWIASIAFILIVGPMFAKTYRIWKLFSGKGFFAKKISDVDVFVLVLKMMIVPIIICIVWMAVERPIPIEKDDHFDDDKVVYRCDSEDSTCRIFEGLMLGYCGCLLVMGVFFAFRARKAASHFNEARFVGLSIYSMTFVGLVGVVLSYVLLGLPVAYYVIICVSFMVGIFCTTMFVYFPKIRICLWQPEKNVYDRSSNNSGKSWTGTSMYMDD